MNNFYWKDDECSVWWALMRSFPCWVLTRICVVVHCITIVLAVKKLDPAGLNWEFLATVPFVRLLEQRTESRRRIKKWGGGDVTVRWCKGLENQSVCYFATISRATVPGLMRSFRDHITTILPSFRNHFANYFVTISWSFSDQLMIILRVTVNSDENQSQLGSWWRICVVGLCIKIVLAGRCIQVGPGWVELKTSPRCALRAVIYIATILRATVCQVSCDHFATILNDN